MIKEYSLYAQGSDAIGKAREHYILETVGHAKVSIIKTLFSMTQLTIDYKDFDLFEVW
ncbi:MAG: hypothetical protein KBT58_08840 [Bizionia sp.]|nr:hypothetical protein [Bizionia sp.]